MPAPPPQNRIAVRREDLPPGWLLPEEHADAVDKLPMISVDLLIFDREGRVLLGLRRNEPAAGTWFVPGGRVRKNEAILRAAARLCHEEVHILLPTSSLRVLNVYEQVYTDDGSGRHYITFTVSGHVGPAAKAGINHDYQQDGIKWSTVESLVGDPTVHHYVKNYFHPCPWNSPLHAPPSACPGP